MRRGQRVTSVGQDGNGVSVEWAADGDTTGRVHGSHLVACDGAHSTVRTLPGTPFPGRAGRMSAVAADLTLATRSAEVEATT